MIRTAALIAAACALTTAACTASTAPTAAPHHRALPGTATPNPLRSAFSTSCGIPFSFVASNGRRAEAGSCAGMFGPRASHLRVRVGDTIHLSIVGDVDGTPAFPAPVSRDQRIVRATRTVHLTAEYLAERRGRTTLDVTTPFCHLTFHEAHPNRARICPALTVIVTR